MSSTASERTRHLVGSAAEIVPGGRKLVTLEGRSIGIFRVGDQYLAIRNRCPHQGAALCEGTLTGLASSSRPGEFGFEREGEILRCPWHGWEFDLRTGRSIVDPVGTRVKSYQVELQAETYPVLLEESLLYVVL